VVGWLWLLALSACSGDMDGKSRTGPSSPNGQAGQGGGTAGSSEFGNAPTGPAQTRRPVRSNDGGPGEARACTISAEGEKFELPVCKLKAPPDSFDPQLQWSVELGNGFGPPMVANLTDDNGDGKIDLCDTPDVVVIAGFEPPDIFEGRWLPNPAKIYVLDGATGEEHFQSETSVSPNTSPAIGDLDGDGLPEIVAMGWLLDQFLNGEMLSGLVAFDHEGKVKWQVPYDFDNFLDQRATFGVTIADMDSDGEPEVIVSTAVFDGATGELKWNAEDSTFSLSTVITDLDGNGQLDLVTGLQAYDASGELLWDRADLVQGNGLLADIINLVGVYPIVVNMDDDERPEVVLAAGPGIFVLEHDGTTKLDAAGEPLSYRSTDQGLDLGDFNPPTAHDFDGDGNVDIAVGASTGFTVLSRDMELLFQYSMIDDGLTATTAFDFLGDGQAEAIYADKDKLLFFDVAAGELVMTWPHSGEMDYPIVVDVDNDDSAEVIVVSNGTIDTSGFFPVYVEKTAPTVQVLTDSQNRWIPTRRIWNMSNYHVTNVLEDGRVPAQEQPHYQRQNTFRTNVQLEAGGICRPPPPPVM
jgi:outer membrane protein assembly factor BamB